MSNIYAVPGLLETGTHAARPAANAVAKGCLYAETDTSKIFQSDGSSWNTWLDASPSGAGAVPLSTGTTAGDMLYWTASATVARLASAGTTNKWLRGANAAVPTWDYPPGYEFDYVAKTSNTNITATTEGTANTVITGNAVAYDGSTNIFVECFLHIQTAAANAVGVQVWLYDDTGGGAASVGDMASISEPGTLSATITAMKIPVLAKVALTPSNATHTYSIRCSTSTGTSIAVAGAFGAATLAPAFLRQVKR